MIVRGNVYSLTTKIYQALTISDWTYL